MRNSLQIFHRCAAAQPQRTQTVNFCVSQNWTVVTEATRRSEYAAYGTGGVLNKSAGKQKQLCARERLENAPKTDPEIDRQPFQDTLSLVLSVALRKLEKKEGTF